MSDPMGVWKNTRKKRLAKKDRRQLIFEADAARRQVARLRCVMGQIIEDFHLPVDPITYEYKELTSDFKFPWADQVLNTDLKKESNGKEEPESK